MKDGGGGDCHGETEDFEFYSDLYCADGGIDSGEWYDDGDGDDARGDEDDDGYYYYYGCGDELIQELCFPPLDRQCPVDLWVM